jgi:hypothetical protein
MSFVHLPMKGGGIGGLRPPFKKKTPMQSIGYGAKLARRGSSAVAN